MADGPASFAALTWLYAVDDHGLHHAVATLEPRRVRALDHLLPLLTGRDGSLIEGIH